MALTAKTVLIQSYLLFFSFIFCGQKMNEHTKVAVQIVNANSHLLDSCKQVLVIYNEIPEDHKTTLMVMEKPEKVWKNVGNPIHAGVGKNGFAKLNKKKEGDGKSPTGLFRLGHLFSYESDVKSKMPFTQTTSEDKWIDDPDSNEYNRHVRGQTDAKSFENLKLKNDLYKYCMVIEYNTNPVIKGKGSAIFLHLNEKNADSTSGCVAINETNMKWILEWMNPELNPSIIMGNKKELLTGF